MARHTPGNAFDSIEIVRAIRALFEFSREVARTPDPDHVGESIVQGAVGVLLADWVCLYQADESGQFLRMTASTYGREFCERAPEIDLGNASLAAEAFRTQSCMQLPASPVSSPEHRRPPDSTLPALSSSSLYVPLLGSEGCRGVLVLGAETPASGFSQLEVDTALAFAGHAALALENARLFAHEQAKNRQWEALLDVCRLVSSSLDRDVILRRIMEHATVLVPGSCTLFLVDPERAELYPIATSEREFVDEIMAVRLSIGEGITGDVARTGRAEIIPHSLSDPRAKQVANTPRVDDSLCCVPLVSKDVVLGVMALSRNVERPFSQDELELLMILAHHGSVAIENARLYGEARHALHNLELAQEHLVRAEKLNAFGQVAGGVAHDFNNLLTAILGRAQLLLMRCDEPKLREGLKIIERTAQDGAQTVRRIQEFTRVRQDQNFTSLDLNDVVRSSLEMVTPTINVRAPEKSIELRVNLGELPRVDASASELREVLTNLVLNAVDAMPLGGLLEVSTHHEGGQVVLHVDDTGVGMSPEVLSHAFDPFYTTKKGGGTGLGLSIALGIVTRHKGSLRAEPRRDGGTRFLLSLPVGQLTGSRLEETVPATVSQLRVLVVDDEPTVREVMSDLLASLGHEVVSAEDGLRGIELMRQTHVDIVMTDLGLPGMNGWQVAQSVKREFPVTPVILVTGWGGQVNLAEAHARGVDHLLTKPVELDAVMRVLAEAVRLPRNAA